jgi:hypothetical protein
MRGGWSGFEVTGSDGTAQLSIHLTHEVGEVVHAKRGG